jgi:hypothetical protein
VPINKWRDGKANAPLKLDRYLETRPVKAKVVAATADN